MIYTVTMNPALDRTIEVDGLVLDDANRILSDVRYAGGKGIDVSRVVNELGGETIALGLVGGYTGFELEGRLVNEGVLCDFTRIAGENRTNIILVDKKEGRQYLLNAPGPRVTPAEIGLFFEKVRSIPSDASFVVISGSVPQGVSSKIYAQIITTLKARGIRRIALDADGELLREGCKAGPYLIKPNLYEFRRLTGTEVKDMEGAMEEARKVMAEWGIEVVLVSMGPKGLLGVKGEEAYHARPPALEVVSAVGAGDATVAGFVRGLTQGLPFPEALRLATAAGAAVVLTPGTELCHLEDVEEILPKVELRRLS